MRDYEAEVFFYPVPDTPLERVLAFLDANLLAADDPSRDVIVDYPDLSLQVLRSREIIGASGCGPLSTLALQTSRTLIKTPLGAIPPIGFVPQQLQCTRDPALFPQTGSLHPALLALPAVQDDFAVALVFGLLGHDGAALLAVAQIFLMGALVALALQLVVQIRDLSRLRSIGLLGILFLANMVLILLAQFLLSWGNVLGLLPVVGQPMTFISLGASHHLFFALPLCAAALLCASISNALEVYRKGNKRSFTAGWIRQHIRISG